MSEFPEAELVRRTYIIRQMDLPPHISLTKRSLLRWFALSFGLISEKESRSTVLNVLDALLYFLVSKQQNPSTLDIQAYIEKTYSKKVSEKLLRYHLNRMIDSNFIIRKKSKYWVNNAPFGQQGNLKESFSHWVRQPVNEGLTNIEGALEKLQESYKKQT